MAYFGVDKDVRVRELVLAFQNQIRNRMGNSQKLDHFLDSQKNTMNATMHSYTEHGGFNAPGLCRTLKTIFTQIDKDNSGALSRAEFEAGLNAFGIFPKQQDLSALVTFFDTNKDGVIQYEEFLGAIREEMSTRKTILVKKVWSKLADDKDCVDLKDVDFPAFIATLGRDTGSLSMQEFKELYMDLAMLSPSDDFFAKHIEQCWGVHEDVEDKLTLEENLRLLGLIRQRLITLANGSQESYALRKIYMQYDSTMKRGITIVELAGIVAKLGIDVNEKSLRGLFGLIDMNRNGMIEFDELSYFIIDELYK